MILRKLSRYVFFFSLLCSFIYVVTCGSQADSVSLPKIAIFLSFPHPLLEDCSQSCIETLKDFENLPEIVILNAEDSVAKARKIARSLHTDKNVVAIVTLGTIATKVMSHIETQKPVIYAAVPDRETLTLPKSKTNVYGVNDNLDINQYCFAIQAVATNAQSIVYLKPSEPFPSDLQKEIVKKLHASGIEVIEIPITSSTFKTQIRQAIDKRPSAIFIPLSPLPHKEGTAFLQEILKEKIPIVTDDISLIADGACIACSVDYKKSGKQIAQIVHQLLNNHNVESLRKITAQPLSSTTTFNEDIIKYLGIKLHKTERNRFLSFKSKGSEKTEKGKNVAVS
ncbi:ABC transporter substrate-binding protein [Candidatus Chlamydia corallus]|uniref:ABC transporter substrate-binding protein n=1 Tax=Candidatus Chlamydia corallus TaxID=2038470 RepID=UPI001EFC66DC|nr:ABC transporter substrate-binding protein [Candidatus Chlamydia corallus]